MNRQSEESYQEARASLLRVQEFDITQLPREDELGTKLNFSEVVEPAQKLVDFFKRLSETALQDFPDNVLTAIRDQANHDYTLFKQILDFEPSQQDPAAARTTLITNISNAYQPTFEALHPYISYSLHRSADFQRLDSDARSTLQAIKDEAEKTANKLGEHEAKAKAALGEILNVAAEAGVTKQAVHFKAEYDHHTKEAATWQGTTIIVATVLAVYAALSLFIHKIPALSPESTYDAVQLSISKFLIFFVMAYMLFLSAKNFLNHKHNAIVNKHRQNALMTHSALVEASGDEGVRDAVLLQAASCIFSPQSTGYAPAVEGDLSNQKTIVEILSKSVTQAAPKSGQ